MPAKSLDQMKAELDELIRRNRETLHRALDAKYNLIRVSERRWRVVRVSSVADVLHDHADVVTFEPVTPPLKFADALQALKEKRAPR